MIHHAETSPSPSSLPTLLQKRGKNHTRFTLISPEELEIETCSKSHKQSFKIELAKIAGSPSREAYKSGWFNGRVFYFAALATFFAIPMALSIWVGAWIGVILFGLFAAPIAVISVLEARKELGKSYDGFIYSARHGGALFLVESNRPDLESVNGFRQELDRRIEMLSPEVIAPTASDSVASQLVEMHRLFQRGLLTEQEFALVKERLLSESKVQERTVGFAPVG